MVPIEKSGSYQPVFYGSRHSSITELADAAVSCAVFLHRSPDFVSPAAYLFRTYWQTSRAEKVVGRGLDACSSSCRCS